VTAQVVCPRPGRPGPGTAVRLVGSNRVNQGPGRAQSGGHRRKPAVAIVPVGGRAASSSAQRDVVAAGEHGAGRGCDTATPGSARCVRPRYAGDAGQTLRGTRPVFGTRYGSLSTRTRNRDRGGRGQAFVVAENAYGSSAPTAESVRRSNTARRRLMFALAGKMLHFDAGGVQRGIGSLRTEHGRP